jgi:predicted nucleic acid-binding protein
MKRVFADTAYWLATFSPRDQWRGAALRARGDIGDCLLMTTDEVLTEFLTGVAGGGPYTRRMAASLVRRVLCSPAVAVVPQSRETLLAGLALYEGRPDKSYSLTDCISMETMRREGLVDVLTNDRHVQQEGVRVLLVEPGGSA